VDEAAKFRWIAAHLLPQEAAVRGWIARHVRTLSNADADDFIQEAYARMWPLDFDTIENPRAYFYTTVRNLIAEQARHARIVPMERMGEIDALSIVSDEPGPERITSARQELERLRQIIETLPPQCRRTFELRKFDGLSIREAAERLGVTQSTVEKHLTKAYARILDALGRDKMTAGEGEGQIAPFGRQHGTDENKE
jgi:RNA polymerase sigma-70 factor (ECF subfamily)